MDGFLNISADIDAAERLLSDIGRNQLPFALALSLNDTAEAVKRAEDLDIANTFDRPTPFTKKGVGVRRATKTRLMVRVGVKPVQAKYLKRQVEGGVRKPKGKALVVPVGIRLNKYGNLPKGALARAKQKKNVFVARKGASKTKHLAPGVYVRPRRGKRRDKSYGTKGHKLTMLIAFEASATYEKNWKFHDLAARRARVVFPDRFYVRLAQALHSAKR